MHSNHKQVFIVGGFDPWVARLFLDANYRGTRDLHQADVVVFTGGEDINPELYHEEPIPGISFNQKRDLFEAGVFRNARNLGVPMIGICRGAQFLNAMCGGRLWQHVDNHTSGHYIKDLITDEIALVTSTHHQQMRPAQTGLLVAQAYDKDVASLCTIKKADGVTIELGGDIPAVAGAHIDAEVVWYADSRALCFQPHPEHPNAVSTAKYFWNVVERYIDPIVNEGMAA